MEEHRFGTVNEDGNICCSVRVYMCSRPGSESVQVTDTSPGVLCSHLYPPLPGYVALDFQAYFLICKLRKIIPTSYVVVR